jgi:hypothetical protein
MWHRSRWHGVQNMVAWGLEQNHPKLFEVQRYSNSCIIIYMRPKTKTLSYLGAQTSHPKFRKWVHVTHDIMAQCHDRVRVSRGLDMIIDPLPPGYGSSAPILQAKKTFLLHTSKLEPRLPWFYG